MTSEVVVKANASHAVEVQGLSLTGGPVGPFVRLQPGETRFFYVHSGAELLVTEVPDDAPGPACDEPMLKHFAWAHLPERLQVVSRPFGLLAARVVATTLRGPERTACLRKLLEAKDCAVRAAMEG